MELKLTGSWHVHLTLTLTVKDYLAHTIHAFVPPHNPANYPLTMGTAQEQGLGNERFRQNQSIFRLCTAADGEIKKQIITTIQPVFLSTIMDHLTAFGKITIIQIFQHLFSSYEAI